MFPPNTESVASVFIQHLTTSPDQVLQELDSQLIQDARDLRAVIFNNKDIIEEYKSFVTAYLVERDQASVMEKGGMTAGS